MGTIKYVIKGYVTPCPHEMDLQGALAKVGSCACCCFCPFFSSENEEEQTVECDFQEREFVLRFVGKDSHDRPVYKDQDGTLWKNTDFLQPEARFCTAYNNKFEGEPDMPMEVLYPAFKVTVIEPESV